MTKVAGVVASFAPTLSTLGASVSVVALGAALTLANPVEAQTVTNTTLMGPADPDGNDLQQIIQNNTPNNILNVTTAPGFGINTANNGTAITLQNFSTLLTLVDENQASITGGYDGIAGYTEDGGDLSISVSGRVEGEYRHGIYAKADAPTVSDIEVFVENDDGTAEVIGVNDGVRVLNDGQGSIDVGVNAAFGSDSGIFVRNGGLTLDTIALSVSSTTPLDVWPGDTPVLGPTPNMGVTVTSSVRSIGANNNGIDVRDYGPGDLTVDVTNEDGTAYASGGENGIDARNYNGGSLLITANNASGDTNGIKAVNGYGGPVNQFNTLQINSMQNVWIGTPVGDGSDSLTVTTTGNVTGLRNVGIDAQNYGFDDATVDASNLDGTGSVYGQNYGIRVRNSNGGDINITANDVASGYDNAIEATNGAGQGNILAATAFSPQVLSTTDMGPTEPPEPITSNINVRTTGEVTSDYGGGIRTQNNAYGDTNIDATNDAGDGLVSSSRVGISAENRRGGNITIAADNVESFYSTGIYAEIENRGQQSCIPFCVRDVAITNEVNAATTLFPQPFFGQPGDITITTTGDVLGGIEGLAQRQAEQEEGGKRPRPPRRADGIFAENLTGGSIFITSENPDGTASVQGVNNGIFAYNGSRGPRYFTGEGSKIEINAQNVSGAYRDGISARNNGGGIFLFAQPVLLDGPEEQELPEYIPGGIDITVTGSVTGGLERPGLYDLLGDNPRPPYFFFREGRANGISATQYGPGDINIGVSNDEGTAEAVGQSYGIYALAGGGNINIDVDNATGQYQSGVSATAYGGYFFLGPFTAQTVELDGPRDQVEGDGPSPEDFARDITVTSTGVVEGGANLQSDLMRRGYYPIAIFNVGTDGINANNLTPGDITITSANEEGTAEAIGQRSGIAGLNFYGGNISITADNAEGRNFHGILAANVPYGLIAGPQIGTIGTLEVIDSPIDGPVEGPTEYEYQIPEGDISITVSGIAQGGQYAGMQDYSEYYERYYGDQIVPNIALVEPLEGMNDQVAEEEMEAQEPSPNFTYNPALEYGGAGIFAANGFVGDININVTNPDGTAGAYGPLYGIASGNVFGGSTTVTVDNARGDMGAGVAVYQDAKGGSISVTSNSNVSGGTAGIWTINYGSGGTSVSNGGSVDGGMYGIQIVNISDMGVDVNNTGDVSGGKIGILSTNTGPGDTVVVNDGTVSGGDIGISAVNNGDGDMSVTGSGDADGGDVGIQTVNNGAGSTTIGAGSVSGGMIGISTLNEGNGNTSVTSTGDVDGGDAGIQTVNNGNGNTTVAANNVSSDTVGISTQNNGSGNTSVSASGDVSGGNAGIQTINTGNGSTSVTANNVTSDQVGISTQNDGNGDTTVSTTGDVEGGETGIQTVNSGSGDIDVTVAGKVDGASDTGIKTEAADGAMTTITLQEGADVSGGEFAISNNGSDSMTTLEAGSKLSGATSLGDGSDDLTISGDADISGVTLLDGGDDGDTADGFVDVLTFSNFTGTLGAGTSIENWEEGIFSGGDATLALASLDIAKVTLQDDAQVSLTNPDFTLNGDLMILGNSALNAGVGGSGNVMLMGNVQNDGLISLSNGNAGDMLTIAGHFSGSGDLSFDVDFGNGTNDTVDVGGDTTGEQGVNVNGTGQTATPDEFLLVSVAGDSADNNFSLNNPNAVSNEGSDAIANGAFLYTLDRRPASGGFVLTPFDSDGNLQYNPSAPVFEALPGIFTELGGLDDFLSRFQGQGGSGNGGEGVAQALLDFSTTEDQTFYTRITGSTSDRDLTNILNTNVDTDATELSMGFDVPMYEGSNGTLFGGFNFSYVDADSSVTSFAGVGSIDTEAFGYTFSAFYLTDGGLYVDGRYRYSFFDTDVVVSTGLGSLGLVTEGNANSTSLEVGKLIGLSNGMTIIPQLQVQHVDASGDPLVDPLTGTALGIITDGEVTTGRVGLWVERDTERNTVFGSVSVFHDFDGTTTTTFAGVPFSSKREDTRLELGVGGEVSVGTNSTVFGRVFAAGGLGDWSADETYTATAGVRLDF